MNKRMLTWVIISNLLPFYVLASPSRFPRIPITPSPASRPRQAESDDQQKEKRAFREQCRERLAELAIPPTPTFRDQCRKRLLELGMYFEQDVGLQSNTPIESPLNQQAIQGAENSDAALPEAPQG